ncbi:MAG: aminotransferase class III-fold pyridoxal phosphate-dependent enzyme [Phycisphaerae bacterium]
MQIGIAVVDITPEPGVELSGGAFGPAESVGHPLEAKVLLCLQGAKRICLISCDLLGFSSRLADRIRRKVSLAADVPFDAVCLTATHTHGAPGTVFLRRWGAVDEAYCDRLVEQIGQAAAEAADSVQTARLEWAATQLQGVATIRTGSDKAQSFDQLIALRWTGEDGKALAVVVNFACHPVNLHSSGQITADFPHYLQQQIRSQLQAESLPVLYLNSAAGDVNPSNFQPGQPSQDAAEQTGSRIAQAALAALAEAETAEQPELAFCCLDTSLPLAPLPDATELQKILAERTAKLEGIQPDPTDWTWTQHQAAIDWARAAIEAVEKGSAGKALPVTLQALQLGPVRLVAVPGEIFSAIGRQIADFLPDQPVLPVALANGCVGYLPDEQAYQAQRYEAVHCPRYLGLQMFQPNVGKVLVEACRSLLTQLGHMHANPVSRQLWGESCSLIVGGGQAHKRPVKYMYRGGPAFAVRAKGSRFWDADGREYIDYLLSYGPIVIGHCDPRVNAAVRRQMDDSGTVFSVEHPLAIEMARTLCELIPAAEMVMYFLGGSAATLGAVRVARAHTGREEIIRCGYHGWYDAFPPLPAGVARTSRSHMHAAPYNDAASLEQLLCEHRGKIAGVIVESVQGDGPRDGYFDKVRKLCDEHGAVFILDEVKTGFRFDLGGAQKRFGIEPDLACFGKAMCNGYPGSVLVGRREVMEDRTDTFLAATFHSDALSLAAASETISILKQEDGIGHFQRLGTRLIEGCNDIFAETSLPMRIGGFAAMPDPAENGTDHPDNPVPPAWQGQVFGAFFGAMQRRGIYVTGHPWFLSLAHNEADIDQTLDAARASALEARDELTRCFGAGISARSAV